MKIDLHIHTRTGSDGNLVVADVFQEASRRGIGFMSITDHDCLDAQPEAITLASWYGIGYVSGVELNVSFQYNDRSNSLDFLGYGFDIHDERLRDKLRLIREHRERRAGLILEKLNAELEKEGIPRLTDEDIRKIAESVDGAFGRPHIADYLEARGIVRSRQEAFDKYLVRLDVPKYPLGLEEAADLVHRAGGILVHAHPNDPRGTSLATITADLAEQTGIIRWHMLPHIDGVECWHPGHDAATVRHYLDFAREHRLVVTGGSDCHQKPVILGSVDVPDYVAAQLTHLRQGAPGSK